MDFLTSFIGIGSIPSAITEDNEVRGWASIVFLSVVREGSDGMDWMKLVSGSQSSIKEKADIWHSYLDQGLL